jgi:hypothetical protein
MIASPESQTFTLPDGREVTFQFFLARRFGHVLRDHILNEREPWERILHVKVKKRENYRQQLDSADVLERDAAEEELYPLCVEILAQGIDFSAGLPLFVEFIQERRGSADSTPYETHGYYFIGEAGFLIVVREDILRTAWFEVGIKGSMSRVGLFREAWKYVLARTCRVTEYPDSKEDEYVRHVRVQRVSEENRAVCPV